MHSAWKMRSEIALITTFEFKKITSWDLSLINQDFI
jgi:hypothetical protein